MQKKSLLQIKSSSLTIVALILGAVLGVGGSVFATSIGNSITTSTDLIVTGNTGLGTTTPSMVLGVQGVGNFASTGSTVYSTLTFPSFTATSTSASNGIGTTTPGSILSIQGVGNFVNAATSTLYTDLVIRSISATSTIYHAAGTALVPSFAFASDVDTGLFNVSGNILGFSTGGSERAAFTNSGSFGVGTTSPGGFVSLSSATSSPGFLLEYTGSGPALYVEDVADDTTPFVIDTNGNVGVGTSTVGSILSVQGVANFTAGTSTIYSAVSVPNFTATTTTATSTIAGGLTVATSGNAAAFGVATTGPSRLLSVAGNALIGGSGTTTLTLTTSTASTGSCIEMRAGTSTQLWRMYIGTNNTVTQLPLVIEPGSCNTQVLGQ